MNHTEGILELNRRVINHNKEKTIDTDKRLVVPKFDVGVALVWFQQAGIELYSKREVAAGRVYEGPQWAHAPGQGTHI